MTYIGNHQNATVQRFLRTTYVNTFFDMGIRLKYYKSPTVAKTVPIGETRKRGRPAKVESALLVQ